MPGQFSDKHLELMNAVKDSGAVDFAKLGEVVSQVTPQLFDPGVVADNYIASGYSDVVKVWKQSVADSALGDPAAIRGIAATQLGTGQIATPGQQ